MSICTVSANSQYVSTNSKSAKEGSDTQTYCLACKKKFFDKPCIAKKCTYHKKPIENSLCPICYCDIFPFNSLDDDSFRDVILSNSVICDVKVTTDELNKLEFEFIKDGVSFSDQNLDPDVNFYNNIKISKCSYLTEMEIKKITKQKSGNFSIIHLNCRSLKKNFDKLLLMLNNIGLKFDVIAISETWLSDIDDMNIFNIDGYSSNFTHRNLKGKMGGGVMIYTNDKYNVKKLDSLCLSEDLYMESLALEIDLNYVKIKLTCIYKPPSANVTKI